MRCNEMIEMNIFRNGSNFFKYDRPQSFEVELYLRKFEPKKVNRENCFYNDAQWNGNYGKILEKWKHDGTPYDIDSVMHYAAHICSHNSQPVLVDKKTGQPVQPGKQKTNSLSGR